MVAKIVVKVHPDTYPTHLSGFLTYDGVTMPKSHEWTDAHIPRTDRPVRFSPGLHQYGHETPDYGRLIPTHRYSPSFTHR